MIPKTIFFEREFVCVDCGQDILSLGPGDDGNICCVCRFIREVPDLPDAIIETLRCGDANTEDTTGSSAGGNQGADGTGPGAGGPEAGGAENPDDPETQPARANRIYH